jgi:hypothetical protein
MADRKRSDERDPNKATHQSRSCVVVVLVPFIAPASADEPAGMIEAHPRFISFACQLTAAAFGMRLHVSLDLLLQERDRVFRMLEIRN